MFWHSTARSGRVVFLLAAFVIGNGESRLSAAAPARDAAAVAVRTPPAPELRVKAWRTLGPGKAARTPDAINPPDGVAFTGDGLLLATDAKNHRVQVFDPMSGNRLGSFGGPNVFTGEVVAIAVAPDGSVAVSDAKANRVHVFARDARAPAAFAPAASPPLEDARFKKLAAVSYDSAGRLYVIDDVAGVVHRYLPGWVPDPEWKFAAERADGGPWLHRADGIALHPSSGTILLSSEWDGVVRLCDARTGRWLGKCIGRQSDPASGRPIGLSVFSRSVEGLAVLGDYLLAMDEGFSKDGVDQPGHLLVFRLDEPAVYQTDAESCRARLAAGKPAGLVGWLGQFASPDGVAVFHGDPQRPDALVAVADQGHYRVVVYRASELLRALRHAARESR